MDPSVAVSLAFILMSRKVGEVDLLRIEQRRLSRLPSSEAPCSLSPGSLLGEKAKSESTMLCSLVFPDEGVYDLGASGLR